MRETGLARSTVSQRVDALLEANLIYEDGDAESTGGRPAGRFAFNDNAGVVLAADIGATHSRVGVSDLGARMRAEVALDLDVADGPERVLGVINEQFRTMLDELGIRDGEVRGIGIGIPGPVEFASGKPVAPPIMPGWDGFAIPQWFAEHFPGAPVLVDNDVNIMALGEHWAHWRDVEHLMYVKVGTGIGSGIVAGRRIHRGADGAAGDIGHIVVTDHPDVVCRCGNTGCLEAAAGGRALAQQLAAEGFATTTSRDVVQLVREGNPEAIRVTREAGRMLGEVLASCVNFFNPKVIVVGGDLSEAQEHLLAGVREVVFQRSLPLATRDLRIAASRLSDHAGVTGAAIMVVEHVLAPPTVDQALRAALAS